MHGGVIFPSVSETFGEALAAFASCGLLFLQAKEQKRIYFDDQVVSTGLEIISNMTAHAATLNLAEQDALMVHWIRHGPLMCQEIITNVERRNPPVMHASDLIEKLVKP